VVQNSSVYRPLKAYPAAGPAGLVSNRWGLPSNRRKPEELGTEALRKWPHHAGCGDNRVSRLPLVARVQEADDEDDGRECGSALCVDRMKASLTLYPLQSEATTHLQFRKQDYGVSSITAEVHV
jgi:hypothetical protein